MGVDVCFTNHAEVDADDSDVLLTMLGVAGCGFVITVPGSDDVMLDYQSLSFHDALYVRRELGLRPAPEFEDWLVGQGLMAPDGTVPEVHPGARACPVSTCARSADDRAVLVLIGERPGFTPPDSLGAYLTWAPRVGRHDAERNCVSDIRPPHGLGIAEAADVLVRLLAGARALGASGVQLKDVGGSHAAPLAGRRRVS